MQSLSDILHGLVVQNLLTYQMYHKRSVLSRQRTDTNRNIKWLVYFQYGSIV